MLHLQYIWYVLCFMSCGNLNIFTIIVYISTTYKWKTNSVTSLKLYIKKTDFFRNNILSNKRKDTKIWDDIIFLIFRKYIILWYNYVKISFLPLNEAMIPKRNLTLLFQTQFSGTWSKSQNLKLGHNEHCRFFINKLWCQILIKS